MILTCALLLTRLDCPCEDFQNQQIVDDSESIYTLALQKFLLDDEIIDQFYDKKEVYLEGKNLKTNEYVMLISNANEKKTALGKIYQ